MLLRPRGRRNPHKWLGDISDASEANIAVLDWQNEHWEPIGADEQWPVIAVDTAHADLGELVGRIRALKR
jgi:hypothetical protein